MYGDITISGGGSEVSVSFGEQILSEQRSSDTFLGRTQSDHVAQTLVFACRGTVPPRFRHDLTTTGRYFKFADERCAGFFQLTVARGNAREFEPDRLAVRA